MLVPESFKNKGLSIMQINTAQALSSWLSEEDLRFYASKFAKSGFTGGLNSYRNLDQNWELTAAWTGVQVKVPVKFITGELLDMVYTSPGIHEYIQSGRFKNDVPNMEEVIVQEGVGQNYQEAAGDISTHIYDFIKKF